MNTKNPQRLQRKIKELHQNWELLGDILAKLNSERILETRVDEKMRLEQKIADIEAERRQVEEQLDELEAQVGTDYTREDVAGREAEPHHEPPRQHEVDEQSKVGAEAAQQPEPVKKEPRQKEPPKKMKLWTKVMLVVVGGITLLVVVVIFLYQVFSPPIIHLRSEPMTISKGEAMQVFGLNVVEEDEYKLWRPLQYIKNKFEDQGEIVLDHMTGLMWQKRGSAEMLTYKDAQEYVEELNRRKFAEYNDWRLPTIPELISLLEPKKQSNGLYIKPIFDATQRYCWSADIQSSEMAWDVTFHLGNVYWPKFTGNNYVRAVRSISQESTSQESLLQQTIRLRNEPLTVSEEEFWKMFKLDEKRRPLEYIQNDYEDQGEVMVDHATGLMWQKSGSPEMLIYTDAQKYVEELNRQKFAGYDDWRLPTIPELMSLLEPTEKNGDLYIDPVFDATQRWCWSADKSSSGAAWGISFSYGYVLWSHATLISYVRVVRS